MAKMTATDFERALNSGSYIETIEALAQAKLQAWDMRFLPQRRQEARQFLPKLAKVVNDFESRPLTDKDQR